MSDREQDRWRELADLLGLPPDEQRGTRGEGRGPSPEITQSEQTPNATRLDEPGPSLPEAALPAEQLAEPAMFEEVVITEMNIDEEDYRAPEPQPREPAADVAEESADDRPRRGRRRGRRGSRNERDDRAPVDNGTNRTEANEPRADDRSTEELGDQSERGRGRHRPDDAPRDYEEERADEELPQAEQAETVEPTTDDADDEEIDRLTDWNVPSWNDLIGSLYRPER